MIRRFNDNTMLVTGGASAPKPVKRFDSGKQVGELSINADYRDGAAVWVTVKAWGHLADTAALVRKGDCVLVTGRYSEREYNGKTYKECIADCIIGAQEPGEALEPPVMPDEEGYTDAADDELPF